MFCRWCGSSIRETDSCCENCKRQVKPLSAHGGMDLYEIICKDTAGKRRYNKIAVTSQRWLLIINILFLFLNSCLLLHTKSKRAQLVSEMTETVSTFVQNEESMILETMETLCEEETSGEQTEPVQKEVCDKNQ